MADAEHRAAGLAQLASAIAGRRTSVQFGDQSYADGQMITLAANRGDALWLDVCAQAALIGAGSLDPALLRSLIGRHRRARRYLYLEVLRASHMLQDRLPWGFSQHPELQLAQRRTQAARESLAVALGSEDVPEPPLFFGTIRPLLGLRHAGQPEGPAGVHGSDQSGKLTAQNVQEHQDGAVTERSALLRLLQNPFSNGNALTDMLNDLLGAGLAKGDPAAPAGSAGSEVPVGRVERSLRRGAKAVISKLRIALPGLEDSSDSKDHVYPEWDMAKQQYRRNWVHIQQADPWPRENPSKTGEVLSPPPLPLRRQMAALASGHEMRRRQNDGTDLDQDAMIDYAIQICSGDGSSRPDVYRASRRMRRDLGVVILLDISGSTGQRENDEQAIFKKQCQLAYHLGRSVDLLGDVSAIIGFHSWGRKQMRAVQIKGYQERWNHGIHERFALLEPVGYTRTGAAIRHGTKLLRHTIRQPNKLLLIITDGIPYDDDYELSYAAQDTRKAVQEARAAGTACVCLTVGADTPAATLVEIFSAGNILMMDEPEQARLHIRRICRQALLAVSKRRATAWA